MREIVLFGYHWDEYQRIFDLTKADARKRLLEFGSGPSAVNAELHQQGLRLESCDPLFALSQSDLCMKTALIFEERIAALKQQQAQLDFSRYGGMLAFIARRKEGLDRFFADYAEGLAEKRYWPLTAERLPFKNNHFDLALSSHYFFSDLAEQDSVFHLHWIKELCRVAKELRIFPLVDGQKQRSALLGPVLLALQEENYGVEIRNVADALDPNGNAMLRIWPLQCELPTP